MPLLVLRNADSGPVSGLPPPSNCPKRAPTRMDSEDASDDDDAEMADYGCNGTDDEDTAHPLRVHDVGSDTRLSQTMMMPT